MQEFHDIIDYAFANFSIHASQNIDTFHWFLDEKCSTDEEAGQFITKMHKILYMATDWNDQQAYAKWCGMHSKGQILDWLHF